MIRTLIATFIVFAACVGAAPPANAQSLWMPRDRESAVMLETLKPSLDGVSIGGKDFLTFGSFLGFRSAPKSQLSLVAEASLARMGADFIPEADLTFGNIYLGAEYGNSAGPFFGELGFRLPTAQDDELYARLAGMASDLVRSEAFYRNSVTVAGAVNFRKVGSKGGYYRIRLSPLYVIPTDDTNPSRHSELYAVYSGQLGVEQPSMRLGVGLIGRTWLTSGYSLADYGTDGQVDVHFDFGSGSFRPGVEFNVGVREDSQGNAPYTVGLSLSYSH